MPDNTSENRKYALPHVDNRLQKDVGRIIAALQSIDVDIYQLRSLLGVKGNPEQVDLTGAPTADTPQLSESNRRLATTAYVKALILEALNNDLDFAETVLSQLATKMAKAGGDFTGLVTHRASVTFSEGALAEAPEDADIDKESTGPVGALEVHQEAAGKDALVAFNAADNFASHFGIDGDLEDFVVGGGSHGVKRYRVWHEHNNNLVGQVAYFASTTAPSGWLKANGAEVSREVYSALFAVIGTTFGGGGESTTFNLPDLRGEFLRGWGSGPIGAHQDQSFKSFTVWNHLGPTRHYSHGGVYMSKTQRSGRLFGGAWQSPCGLIQFEWDGSEVHPRNVSLLACIKY